MFKSLSKLGSLVSASAGAVSDAVTGTIEVGSEIKESISNEMSAWKKERNMKLKADQLLQEEAQAKRIAKALGITKEQAKALLRRH